MSPIDGQRPSSALGPDFTQPIDDRYFEDYVVGSTYEYGHVVMTEHDIVDFARRFDPQLMHVDRAWAERGPFGGIIASGWHTSAVFMRLFADHYLSRVASLASPGVDELRWPAPVRPDDVLRLRATVAEARPSSSKPDRGLVVTVGELLDGSDRCVLRLRAMNLIGRRTARST